jgi:SAM-dependent methyltransferase
MEALLNEALKKHWETVYETKDPHEVSWTQEKPTMSLHLIDILNLAKDASIIDIGGGDSKLVDFLLAAGYLNISVLDISENALQKAQKRLGDKADLVTWIVADITQFVPTQQYDLWHDRAVFHFLTKDEDVQTYQKLLQGYAHSSVVIGTFSEDGPLKCSGLSIRQYNEESLTVVMQPIFEKVKITKEEHTTPFNTQQNFIFGLFRRV